MFQSNFRKFSAPFDSELEFSEILGFDFGRYTVGSLKRSSYVSQRMRASLTQSNER